MQKAIWYLPAICRTCSCGCIPTVRCFPCPSWGDTQLPGALPIRGKIQNTHPITDTTRVSLPGAGSQPIHHYGGPPPMQCTITQPILILGYIFWWNRYFNKVHFIAVCMKFHNWYSKWWFYLNYQNFKNVANSSVTSPPCVSSDTACIPAPAKPLNLTFQHGAIQNITHLFLSE